MVLSARPRLSHPDRRRDCSARDAWHGGRSDPSWRSDERRGRAGRPTDRGAARGRCRHVPRRQQRLPRAQPARRLLLRLGDGTLPLVPGNCRGRRRGPGLDLGIHLTLNAEKRHYKWRPLTAPSQAAGLTDETGFFWPNVARPRAGGASRGGRGRTARPDRGGPIAPASTSPISTRIWARPWSPDSSTSTSGSAWTGCRSWYRPPSVSTRGHHRAVFDPEGLSDRPHADGCSPGSHSSISACRSHRATRASSACSVRTTRCRRLTKAAAIVAACVSA